MMDSLQRANCLFSWAEQQQLNSSQLEHAAEQRALQPGSADWLAFANRLLLIASVLLLSSAVIFFFANNWSSLHYFSKFLLAAGAVLLSGTTAVFSAQHGIVQRAALLGCCILSGALLALIGQTYQTGADIWQLFASWAALITPLVLLSRSRASYVVWFSLLQLALWRYLETHQLIWLFSSDRGLLLSTLLNLLLLALCQFALPRLLLNSTKPLLWLTALTLLLPLTLGAIFGIWDNSYRLNLLCYLLLSAALAWWYFHQQRDLLIFALVLFSAIAVATSALARLLINADSFFSINLLALFVIASSASSAVWLKKLAQERRYD